MLSGLIIITLIMSIHAHLYVIVRVYVHSMVKSGSEKRGDEIKKLLK